MGNDLVLHDLEAAGEIAVGLEDGAARIVARKRPVRGVVEGAVVALSIFVLELQEAFLAGEVVGDGVAPVDSAGSVMDITGRVEAGFRAGERLEGVRPEGALVGVGEMGKARAVRADGARGLRGEQIGGK